MKKKVILDTDVYNEIDDQYALAYLLKSPEIFTLEAVTIAPFTKGDYTAETSIDPSYETAKKIFTLCNIEDTSNIYKGSREYFKDNPLAESEAVDAIIDIALKNDITYILSIGCITNLALAIKKNPAIIDKIEVIWLGTNFLFMKNDDFNFRQDVEAVKFVLSSKVKLTIMPTYPITSNLVISYYEIEHRLSGKNELCDYFLSTFKEDYGKIKMRRPLWDISVIAYMIKPDWFQTLSISCPTVTDDSRFEMTENEHEVTFVQRLDSNKIYDDLFAKITK